MLKANDVTNVSSKNNREFFAQKHRAKRLANAQRQHEANKIAYQTRKDERRALARSTDPTSFLAANGFVVKKDGKNHFMLFDPTDTRREIARLTYNTTAGCWLACGKDREQIGDNMQLLCRLYGYSYLDAIDALLRHASIGPAQSPAAPIPKALRPTAAVQTDLESLKTPVLPTQTAADIEAGRAYLVSRGVDLHVIRRAEELEALRYGQVHGRQSVLFVGIDISDGTAMSVTHRSIAGSFKGDFEDTNKAFPCILIGDTAYDIEVVEGGTSGLAAQTRAKREGRLIPTVIVTGGATIQKFLDNSLVRELLAASDLERITVWFENETLSPKAIARDAADTEEATILALLDKKQAESDAAHEKQIAGIEALGGPVKVTRARPVVLRHKDVADVLIAEMAAAPAGTMLDLVEIVAAQNRDSGPERA